MELVFWVTFGTLAGWIASEVYGTLEKYGKLKDMLLGILGALYAGLMGGMLEYHIGFKPENVVTALAIVFITVLIISQRILFSLGKGEHGNNSYRM